MSYELKPLERCLTCRAEIFVPPNATSVRCPACRTCMSVSRFTQKEKQVVAEIERLREESSMQGSALSAQIDDMKAAFLASREGRLQELFRQGEEYQQQGQFDNAIERYETLLKDSPNESEVHWRIMLCRYGIEYVREQSSGLALPTITKMYIANIQKDASYQCALQFAPDETIRQFYREEALRINNILMKYQSINGTEPSFDVFISVKQGDEQGRRTDDSDTASDLYYELSKYGWKVFNSRHSLKLYGGTEYEPHIMHALSTSKVMVVMASTEEYMNSPWVRNEWRRFRWLQLNNHRLPQNLQRERRLIAYVLSEKTWAMPELGGLQIINAKTVITPLEDLINNIRQVCGIPAPSQSAFPNMQTMSPEQLNQLMQYFSLFQQIQGMQVSTPVQSPAPVVQTPPERYVDIPVHKVTSVFVGDSALEQALREALNLAQIHPLTQENLATLTNLNLQGKGISDISALQYCTALKTLNLSENRLSDISPLAHCTQLTTLYLAKNQLEDISPLVNCTALSVLSVQKNRVVSLAPLAHCPELRNLNAMYNQISDITPLESCPKLVRLALSHNQISDIKPLVACSALTVLYLAENQISDISPLAHCTKLTGVHLSNNLITNISPLSQCDALSTLFLDNNSIGNLSPLSYCTALKKLYLNDNRVPLRGKAVLAVLKQRNCEIFDAGIQYADDFITIRDKALEAALREKLGKNNAQPLTKDDLESITQLNATNKGICDISALQYCTALKVLMLNSNQIQNIDSLAHCTQLTTLGLSDNLITHISALENCTQLKELAVSHNRLEDISALSHCTQLISLHLSNNQISDLKPLASCSLLKRLCLSDNQIVDLAPLSRCTALTGIELDKNQIGDISPLAQCTALTVLVLNQNRIADVSPLNDCTALKILQLNGNPPGMRGLAVVEALKKRKCQVNDEGIVYAEHCIDVNDAALEAAVRKQLKKSKDAPITKEDLAGLKELSVIGQKVSNLSALRHCTALKTLVLSNNRIVDIAPLAQCTALEKLDLHSNQIADISPLARCTALNELSLCSNQIIDLAPLAHCTALKRLDLSANQIIDLAPLASCTQLKYLQLTNNACSLLGAAVINALRWKKCVVEDEGIRYADAGIDIGDAALEAAVREKLKKSPFAPISKEDLASITRLSVISKQVTNLGALQYCTALKELNLGYNQISDISALAHCTALRELFLSNNQIADLTPLASCTALEWLNLEYNQIADLSPLASCASLKSLNLSHNLSPMRGASVVQALKQKNCTIKDEGIQYVTEGIDIGDDALEAVLRERLNKTNGELITKEDLASIRGLSAEKKGIVNISALRYCTALTELDLDNNQISDISPLANCTALTGLNLSDNQISDITPLTNCTALKWLKSQYNQISDISPLTNCTTLTELNLDNNQISDISPLAHCTALEFLKSQYNQISDISPLANCTALVWLWLNNNVISDISPLANCTALKLLNLENNQITDISPLAHCTALVWLYLDNNVISDISPLAHCTALTTLWLEGNLSPMRGASVIFALQKCNCIIHDKGIRYLIDSADINNSKLEQVLRSKLWKAGRTGITTEDLAGITELSIEQSGVSDITILQYCTSLVTLKLSGNQISDISALAKCTRLKYLFLNSNQISDISPLAKCTALCRLELDKNQIVYVSPLKQCTELRWLCLSLNQISDITALSACTQLESLCMGSNQLSSLAALAGCSKLNWLYLCYNRISDISPLAKCTALKNLQLRDNRLSNIAPLKNCTVLENLELQNNRISDISPLASCTKLKSLNLLNNPLTGIDWFSTLRNATPNARTLSALKSQGCHIDLK